MTKKRLKRLTKKLKNDDEETDESTTEAEQMREYVEKVAGGGLDAQNWRRICANKKVPAKTTWAVMSTRAGGEADTGGTAGGLAGNTPAWTTQKATSPAVKQVPTSNMPVWRREKGEATSRN